MINHKVIGKKNRVGLYVLTPTKSLWVVEQVGKPIVQVVIEHDK